MSLMVTVSCLWGTWLQAGMEGCRDRFIIGGLVSCIWAIIMRLSAATGLKNVEILVAPDNQIFNGGRRWSSLSRAQRPGLPFHDSCLYTERVRYGVVFLCGRRCWPDLTA